MPLFTKLPGALILGNRAKLTPASLGPAPRLEEKGSQRLWEHKVYLALGLVYIPYIYCTVQKELFGECTDASPIFYPSGAQGIEYE